MTPLFSTAYFPPVAYVASLMRHERAEIEVMETYHKQTYRNRAVIMTAGGLRSLSVPVVCPQGNHTRTGEVGIAYRERWNVIHFRTLSAAYGSSPFFLYYKDDIENLMMYRYDRLADLNMAILRWVLEKMKIRCDLEFTTCYRRYVGESMDFRNRFSPKTNVQAWEFPPYYQVFADRHPFAPNLSILDLVMNLGPEARAYLQGLASV